MDIPGQVEQWRRGGSEDWAVGIGLVAEGKARHGLFFIHPSVEKLLKAHVINATGDLPPRIHNLVRLAELAQLTLPDRHLDTLADLNPFSTAGRYPDTEPPPPSAEEAAAYTARAEDWNG